MWRSESRGTAWRASAALATIAAIAGGCAHYHPAPLTPGDHAAALEARTLDDPGLRRFVDTRVAPSVRGGEPSWDLTTLTLAALYYHPDLDVSRAEWGVARAGIVTAGGRPDPGLQGSAGYSPNADRASPWILSLGTDVSLETGGKRGHRIARAQELSEAARLRIASAAWAVRSRVRTALLVLWGAQTHQALAQRARDVQGERVALLERRLDTGAASRPEVTRERIALDEAEVSAREAQRLRAEARAALATAVGIPAGGLEGSVPWFRGLEEAPPPPSRDDLYRQAMLGRADVLALLAEYGAAEAVLRLEVAKQYPDVHLGPGYTFELGEHRYVLGVGLTLPIVNRNKGPIAEAEARRVEAAARFDALQARALGEVARADAAFRAAGEASAAAEALCERQQRRRAEVKRAFDAGAADRLALLDAELELVGAQAARFDAVLRRQQALGLLEDAIQRPLLTPEFRMLSAETSPRGPEKEQR